MGMAERVSASLMASSDSFLSREGSEWTYSRGAVTDTITLYKSDQQPVVVDDGSGNLTEILMVDFRGLTADFSGFSRPQAGDKITDGTDTFLVSPKIGTKAYHTVGSMIHIYTKQVHG